MRLPHPFFSLLLTICLLPSLGFSQERKAIYAQGTAKFPDAHRGSPLALCQRAAELAEQDMRTTLNTLYGLTIPSPVSFPIHTMNYQNTGTCVVQMHLEVPAHWGTDPSRHRLTVPQFLPNALTLSEYIHSLTQLNSS